MSESPSMETTEPGRPGKIWKQVLNVFFASFGFVVLRAVLGPLRIKILTSLLSKEQYGILTVIGLTVSFITLVSSLGSLEFLLRKIPGRSDEYQNSMFKTILLSFGSLSVVLAAAGMGWLLWGPSTKIHLSGTDILACGLLLVLTVHVNQYFYFLMGLSKYALSRIAQLLQGDTWFLPLVVFFWVGTVQIGHVLWVWVIWLALTVAVMYRWIRFSRVWSGRASRGELAEVLRFGLPLLPLILGEWLFMIQDRYVLLYWVNVEAVANYNLCMNIALVGVLVGSAVLDILLVEFFKLRNRVEGSSLGELSAHPELRHHFTDMVRYALLVAIPFGAALVALGRPVILVLSSSKFLDSAPLLVWLAPLPVFYFAFIIFGRVLIGVNQNARVGVATLAGAGLNILLNLALVPFLGERGACLAAVGAYVVLAAYLGCRARAWRWLVWADLQPVRLALLFGICIAGYLLCARHLAFAGSLTVLAGAMLWTAGGVLALGLMKKGDLRLVFGTFARESPEPPPHEPADSV